MDIDKAHYPKPDQERAGLAHLQELRDHARTGGLEPKDAAAQVMELLHAAAMRPSQRAATEAQVYQFLRGAIDEEHLTQSARERLQEDHAPRQGAGMGCSM